MSNDEKDTNTDMAKNIWLAGLGAYGKAFDEASERYEKVSKETSRMFDELVSKGRRLEGETSDKINHTLMDVKEKSTHTLDERITQVRQALGFGEFSRDSKLDELHHKVDALSLKLDQLLAAVEAKPAAKKTTSRTRTAKAGQKAVD